MKTFRHLPLILFVIAILSGSGAAVVADDDTNNMCPVLSDREATSDYAVQYKGKEVRFCCSECIIEFNKHPEIYETVLPQLQEIPLRTRISLFLGEYGSVSVGSVLLLLLIVLRIHRWKHATSKTATPGTFGQLLQKRVSATVPLLALVGYLGFEVYSLNSRRSDRHLKDEIHYATFHDFGFPPTPRRPETEPL